MSDPSVETWASIAKSLRRSIGSAAAQANADLLDAAAERWESVLLAHTSMHDIVFTRPEDEWPWPEEVRVTWRDGVFEFQLRRAVGLVTADRCREANARAVLDAFLLQLQGDIGTDIPTHRP